MDKQQLQRQLAELQAETAGLKSQQQASTALHQQAQRQLDELKVTSSLRLYDGERNVAACAST